MLTLLILELRIPLLFLSFRFLLLSPEIHSQNLESKSCVEDNTPILCDISLTVRLTLVPRGASSALEFSDDKYLLRGKIILSLSMDKLEKIDCLILSYTNLNIKAECPRTGSSMIMTLWTQNALGLALEVLWHLNYQEL